MTVGDCWLLEGGKQRRPRIKFEDSQSSESAATETSSQEEPRGKLPHASAVTLLQVLLHCVQYESQDKDAPQETTQTEENPKKEHYFSRLLRLKYSNYTEISADTTLPLASLLRPLGIVGKVLYYSPVVSELAIQKIATAKKVDNDTARRLFIDSVVPGTAVIETVRPFRLDEMCKHQMCHHRANSIVLPMAPKKTGLLMIDPIRHDLTEYCNHHREYAAIELAHKLAYLSMIIVVSSISIHLTILTMMLCSGPSPSSQ